MIVITDFNCQSFRWRIGHYSPAYASSELMLQTLDAMMMGIRSGQPSVVASQESMLSGDLLGESPFLTL